MQNSGIELSKHKKQKMATYMDKNNLYDIHNESSDICECCHSFIYSRNIHGVFLCSNCELGQTGATSVKPSYQSINLNQKLSVIKRTFAENKDTYCDICGMIQNDIFDMKSQNIRGYNYCSVCAENLKLAQLNGTSSSKWIEKYKNAKQENSFSNKNFYNWSDSELEYYFADPSQFKTLPSCKFLCTNNALVDTQTMRIFPYEMIVSLREIYPSTWEIALSNGQKSKISKATMTEMQWFLFNYSRKFNPHTNVDFLYRTSYTDYSLIKKYSKNSN